MSASPNLLHLVLPVFLVIATGYALRRAGIFTEEGDLSLLGVLVNLLVPTLGYFVCLLGGRLFRRDTKNTAPSPPSQAFKITATSGST